MSDYAHAAQIKALAMLITCLSLKPLMTVTEVAEFLGYSRSRVYSMVKRGLIELAPGMNGGERRDTRILGVSVALYVFGEDTAEVFKNTNIAQILQGARPSKVAA